MPEAALIEPSVFGRPVKRVKMEHFSGEVFHARAPVAGTVIVAEAAATGMRFLLAPEVVAKIRPDSTHTLAAVSKQKQR